MDNLFLLFFLILLGTPQAATSPAGETEKLCGPIKLIFIYFLRAWLREGRMNNASSRPPPADARVGALPSLAAPGSGGFGGRWESPEDAGEAELPQMPAGGQMCACLWPQHSSGDGGEHARASSPDVCPDVSSPTSCLCLQMCTNANHPALQVCSGIPVPSDVCPAVTLGTPPAVTRAVQMFASVRTHPPDRPILPDVNIPENLGAPAVHEKAPPPAVPEEPSRCEPPQGLIRPPQMCKGPFHLLLLLLRIQT